MKKFWKKYHKWVGLFFCFFILMFCISGIILNHRKAFSSFDVSRSLMPGGYSYDNWNNGIARGTETLTDGTVLLYGNTGIWQTDSCISAFKSGNEGLKKGADNRKISNIVTLPDGSVWCAGLYDLYRMNDDKSWQIQNIDNIDERISDIANHGDTLVVQTRSNIYESLPPYTTYKEYQLPVPKDYDEEISLFRTVWILHSGELFGTVGKLFVDFIALVIIILCITGILFWITPKVIKRRVKQKLNVKPFSKTLKTSTQWHIKLGTWLIIPTVVLAVTGMSLRPPMMIPFAMTKMGPVPFSTQDTDNVWHDKFRGIRWDDNLGMWLISTKAGFYQAPDFTSVPEPCKMAPPVSPMGLNVFHQRPSGEWLVGSFSGLFCWNPMTHTTTDYFTGKPYDPMSRSFFGSSAASGITTDIKGYDEVIFDYDKGTRTKDKEQIHIADMPQMLADQPISLWNWALELHVGRLYSPFLGFLSGWFVFLSGLLLTLTLISGYILRPKKKKKKECKKDNSKTGETK